tara:strand:+ start:5252 stop:5767 length:516 start_codon:yes stop_codon:yes gene_type:complete
MSLIRNGVAIDDAWVRLDDDTPAAPGSRAIVSLQRWKAEKSRLPEILAGVGVLLKSSESAEDIADDLSVLEVVAVDFPAFTDGRSYSTARILRERYRYLGEIRAVGDVLRDQYGFMVRCGVDAFELSDAVDTAEWIKAVNEIPTAYQPAADGRSPLFRVRAETPQDAWLAY